MLRRSKKFHAWLTRRFGLQIELTMLPLAALIGLVTACLAFVFHRLIEWISRGSATLAEQWENSAVAIACVILIPALGGLIVGYMAKLFHGHSTGHGVVDVMESVIRSRGFIKTRTAVEKILSSAITIGSGGSAGAEGPIVQIGAAVASGFGKVLQINRTTMPMLVGCGAAAGISSIFHAPIGGVLFVIEVVLRQLTLRTFVPVVVASVVANVATVALFRWLGGGSYHALFVQRRFFAILEQPLDWNQAVQFALLGVVCGVIGVCFTRLMLASERVLEKLPGPKSLRPALGALLMGCIGATSLLIFSDQNHGMFWKYANYPLPPFYGDGYGTIARLLQDPVAAPSISLLVTLTAYLVLKQLATALTLSSGGSGGIIAPSLFVGAVTGALLARLMQWLGAQQVAVQMLTIVGMGAVLAAVVHAPLAAILIIFELTLDHTVVVPAMLGSVIATAVSRQLFIDSIYTVGLRRRGLHPEAGSVNERLRQMSLEHLLLEPASFVQTDTSVEALGRQVSEHEKPLLIVVEAESREYRGIILSADIVPASLEPSTASWLTAHDLMRANVRPLRHDDDLFTALERMTRDDLPAMPVALQGQSHRIIGIVSQSMILRVAHRMEPAVMA
jgi:CIC family chloride channel protein